MFKTIEDSPDVPIHLIQASALNIRGLGKESYYIDLIFQDIYSIIQFLKQVEDILSTFEVMMQDSELGLQQKNYLARDIKESTYTDIKHEFLIHLEKCLLPCNNIIKHISKYEGTKIGSHLSFKKVTNNILELLEIISSKEIKKLDEWKLDRNPLDVRDAILEFIKKHNNIIKILKALTEVVTRLAKDGTLNRKILKENYDTVQKSEEVRMAWELSFEVYKNKISRLELKDFNLPDSILNKPYEKATARQIEQIKDSVANVTRKIIYGED